jgi:hypothetical protein
VPAPPPLVADPNRPVSDWREPPWFPAADDRDRDRARRARDRGPGLGAIVVGLGLVAIGIWYFLDRTLGIAMPEIRWGSLWPLLLIVLGLVIVVRALGRR